MELIVICVVAFLTAILTFFLFMAPSSCLQITFFNENIIHIENQI